MYDAIQPLSSRLCISQLYRNLVKNHKYCFHFFFRLIRYLYPTDDELKTLARVPKDKPKGKKDYKGKNNENGKTGPETFHIPRNLDLEVSIHVPYLQYIDSNMLLCTVLN